MDTFFVGTHEAALDRRGRFLLPHVYRRALAAHAGGQPKLMLVPVQRLRIFAVDDYQKWVQITNRYIAEGRNLNTAAVERRLLAQSAEAAWGLSGRVSIPAAMLRRAGLKPGDALALVGCKDWIEIWQRADRDREEEETWPTEEELKAIHMLDEMG